MVAILFYLIIQLLQLLIASPLFPFTLKLLERNFKPSHKVSFSTYTAGKISQFIGTASFLSLQAVNTFRIYMFWYQHIILFITNKYLTSSLKKLWYQKPDSYKRKI